MRRIIFGIMMMGAAFLSGCGWGMNKVGDFELYESGALKSDGDMYSFAWGVWPFDPAVKKLYGYSSEYYENGLLKEVKWSGASHPVLRLTFYGDGRLKSEERYEKGELVFGTYFGQDGEWEKRVGQRPHQVTK
ncbi:MAG: hypothetical protein AMJ79_15950 [Phycisphaerae bacterium SM23_30]|nr:MAG: hypothetical protein AMJ79_15950 [Phycisphaerae bacterium SM23_30]